MWERTLFILVFSVFQMSRTGLPYWMNVCLIPALLCLLFLCVFSILLSFFPFHSTLNLFWIITLHPQWAGLHLCPVIIVLFSLAVPHGEAQGSNGYRTELLEEDPSLPFPYPGELTILPNLTHKFDEVGCHLRKGFAKSIVIYMLLKTQSDILMCLSSFQGLGHLRWGQSDAGSIFPSSFILYESPIKQVALSHFKDKDVFLRDVEFCPSSSSLRKGKGRLELKSPYDKCRILFTIYHLSGWGRGEMTTVLWPLASGWYAWLHGLDVVFLNW